MATQLSNSQGDSSKSQIEELFPGGDIEIEYTYPEILMETIARVSAVTNPITGEFAFNEHIRNAIGMQLLKYIKRVLKDN